MMHLPIQIHEEPLVRTYFGPELRPHFILETFKIEGSALVAFIGPAQVKTESLVDWEDRLSGDRITAKKMIHFLGEFYGITLETGVWIQRLLVSETAQILNELLRTSHPAPSFQAARVFREGDDLYFIHDDSQTTSPLKLSVSIVTASPLSVLLHFAINLDADGAPVQALGLEAIFGSSFDPSALIQRLLLGFQREAQSVARACVKVRPVI